MTVFSFLCPFPGSCFFVSTFHWVYLVLDPRFDSPGLLPISLFPSVWPRGEELSQSFLSQPPDLTWSPSTSSSLSFAQGFGHVITWFPVLLPRLIFSGVPVSFSNSGTYKSQG